MSDLPSYFDDYEIIKTIATNYSTVYITRYKTGEMRAVKELTIFEESYRENRDRNVLARREKENCERAINAANDHIIKIYETYQSRPNARIFIVSKYYENETLADYLEKKPNGRLPEEEGLAIFHQICIGYDWFVENKLMHRDLKLTNIFMDGDKPVIGDLGMSRELEERNRLASSHGSVNPLIMSKRPFSDTNRSPEQIKGSQTYSTPSDIWGLGLILYQMLVGKFPFEPRAENKNDIEMAMSEDDFILPPKELGLSKDVIKLIDQLLQKDPTKRISWENLMNHDLFKLQNKSLKKDSIERINSESLMSLSLITFQNKDVEIAAFCVRAIIVVNNCQKEISLKLKKNFLPFGVFLPLVYGLTRIGTMRLEKTLRENPNLSLNAAETQIKKTLYEMLSDPELARLIEVFSDLFDTPEELISTLLTPNEKDYENEFREWFDRNRDIFDSAAANSRLSSENKDLYLQYIGQMAQYLDPSYGIVSPSKGKKKIVFLEDIKIFKK